MASPESSAFASDSEAVAEVSRRVRARLSRVGTRPKLVAITGSVAAGKSTFAQALAAALTATGESVEVVATDGFLRSEQELASVGLLERKGFPESYDAERFAAFLREVANGTPVLRVPVYSHRTRAVESLRDFAAPGYLLVEGVYVVQPIREAGLPACTIFVDADQSDVRAWYFARRRTLRAAGADHVALDVLAERAWLDTNVPNYTQHIALQREAADIVVCKAADHRLLSVRER
jgi:type I pantothenate kinase